VIVGGLAYLFPAFPVFHQTFVLWEVLGLQRCGVNPRIYSLRRPSARQQPEGEQVIRDVTYLPHTMSGAVLGANWRLLRAGPRRYLGLYVAVWKAWRTGAGAPAGEVSWEQRPTILYWLRVWLKTQPVLYLLKSLGLVPIAAYLAEQLAAERITHLHAHWASYPGTVAYVVSLISGISFSISAHAYDIYMVPRMLPAKLRMARFVVTCARANASFLERLEGAEPSRNVIVNYHGVDVTRFTPSNNRRPSPRLRIVSCGQLEQYKGMHLLIEACAQLQRRGIPLECWIIGDGPQRRQLERQIGQLAMGETVHLFGSRPQAEVAECLSKADIFVLASVLSSKLGRRDVIANVIVEAMAAGLPVVASSIPGVEELVEHGCTGLLVPPNRTDELADAIAALACNAEDRSRFGQAGRRRIMQDFDSDKNVRALAALLANVAGTAGERLTTSAN
jgi:colanic acid/amylovoran biosynthesis glycosyltransferase